MIREYETKLRAAGKVVETYLPAEDDHGFYGGSSPEAKEAQEQTFAFFKKYLTTAK
jgi:acetyl esterase/lipase